MAVVAPQAGILGPYGPDAPQAVPVGATTVNTTNPNVFAVNVTPSNSVSNATITNVKVNGVTVGAVGGVAYVVPANATFQTTYASGTTTYATTGNPGASPVITGQYPYTDPVFQNFNVQQYLTVSGVAPGTYSLEAPKEDERPVNDEGESLNKDGSVSKRQPEDKPEQDKPKAEHKPEKKE